MKSLIWIALFIVVLGISFLLVNNYFSYRLYNFMVESYQYSDFEFSPLKVIEDVKPVQLPTLEKQVRLSCSCTMKENQAVDREFLIYIPESAQESKRKTSIHYAVGFQDIGFYMSLQDCILFNLENNSTLLKTELDQEGIPYSQKWFEMVETMTSSKTDEDLFIESMATQLTDIKKSKSVEALYKAVLYSSIRYAYGSGESYVFYDGVNSLYFFPQPAGPEKVSLQWVLYKNKSYYCSGMISRRYKHNYDKTAMTELVSYLKTILVLQE